VGSRTRAGAVGIHEPTRLPKQFFASVWKTEFLCVLDVLFLYQIVPYCLRYVFYLEVGSEPDTKF
jgi:hypothetical protein